jgi:CRP/FNR family transcriptional regulator
MVAVSPCPHGYPGEACIVCKVRLFSVCAALSATELSALDEIAQHVRFSPRETIFLQGADAHWVYNITSGVARLYTLLPDGRRQIVGFALPGDFLGLAMGKTHPFGADAIDQVSACRFSRTAFSLLIDRKPHLLRRLHEFATHELSLAQDQMALLGRRTAEEKVIMFLLGMRERWARLGSASVTVHLPMSRQDMADFLGLSLETVSRTLNRLARERAIILVPDGVRITNLERLARPVAA